MAQKNEAWRLARDEKGEFWAVNVLTGEKMKESEYHKKYSN